MDGKTYLPASYLAEGRRKEQCLDRPEICLLDTLELWDSGVEMMTEGPAGYSPSKSMI